LRRVIKKKKCCNAFEQLRLPIYLGSAYLTPTGALSNYPVSRVALLRLSNGTAGHFGGLAPSGTRDRIAPLVPTMTNLSDLNVLIVDLSGLDGSELRKMFINACAITHVAESYATATTLIENTKIDAVLMPFATDGQTITFSKALSEKNIPCIFTSEPPPRYSNRRPMSEAIVAIQAVLAQQPQGVSNRVAHH
jgi:hypothetical protein